MDQHEIDLRIAKIKGQHPIEVEQGSEVHVNSKVGKGQMDANVAPPTPVQAQAARVAERSGVVDQIRMSDNTVNPDDVVTIGDHVVLYPQPLRGFEAQFTKGGLEPYVVLVDDVQQIGGAALAAVFTALREQAQAKRGGKRS